MIKGYWNNDKATAEVIDADGWFHTGDVGKFEDGYLRITDRIKHMLVSKGGKNIYPDPIEDRFKTHQLVDQMIVIQAGFEAVLQEENGQNKLNLLASLYEQKDASDIRKNLANFLNETQLAEFDAQVALLDNSNTGSSLVNKTAGLGDDITYGTAASVVMLGASIAYNYIPWFKPLAKAAVIVGIAAGAATTAHFINKINLAYEANALPGEGFAAYIRRETSNWGVIGVGVMIASTTFAMNQGRTQRGVIALIIGSLMVYWTVTA